MSAGFGLTFLLEALRTFTALDLPIYSELVILDFLAGLVAFWLGSLGQRPDEQTLRFRQALFEDVPAKDRDPVRVERTLRYAYVTIGACVAVSVFLFLVYYLPYTQTVAAAP